MTSGIPERTTGGFDRLFIAVLIGLPLIAIAVFVGITAYWELTATSTGDIDSLIRERVQEGSSAEEIFRFLDDEGIGHGPIDRDNTYCCILQEAGFPSETIVISAIVHDSSRGWFGSADIWIFFILDSNFELREYLAEEVYTSL